MAPYPIFVNARAGTQRLDVAAIAALFDPADSEVRVVEPAELHRHVSAAVDAGAALIAVAGGDGTLRSAAAALLGTSCALLPVPTGTFNHFARRVGIRTPSAAADALAEGRVRAFPVGLAGDDIFLNTLTVGAYARAVRIRERWRRYLRKWPAAALGFGLAIARLQLMNVTLQIDDARVDRLTPFLWVGVGLGSFPRIVDASERRAHPDLEVAVLRPGSRAAALAFLLRLPFRMLRADRPVRDRALDILHTRELLLDTQHGIEATADGEVLHLRAPVHIRVRAAALLVYSPYSATPPST